MGVMELHAIEAREGGLVSAGGAFKPESDRTTRILIMKGGKFYEKKDIHRYFVGDYRC